MFLQVLITSDNLQVRLRGGGELDHGVRAGQPGVDASSRSLSAPLHQTSQSFQSNQVSSGQWSSAPYIRQFLPKFVSFSSSLPSRLFGFLSTL